MAQKGSLEDFMGAAVDAAKKAGELFTAIRGKGAFLNGKPIKASSQYELVKSLLATELVQSVTSLPSMPVQIGSIAYFSRVASGRLDLLYELGFGGPWDVAARAVIVTEAGGVVFDLSGKEFDLTSQRVAASNTLLKDAFIEALPQSD